jgi:hypothetical protein
VEVIMDNSGYITYPPALSVEVIMYITAQYLYLIPSALTVEVILDITAQDL